MMERDIPPDFTTGQTTVHWFEGEPLSVDVFKRGPRRNLDENASGRAS
jgi:hypothetical protein